MGKRIPAVGGACRGGMGRLGRVVFLCAALLAAGCGPKEPPKPPTRIIIASAPEAGALVLLAGEDRGATPVTVEGLPAGKYEAVLTLDRFKRTFADIEVKGEPGGATLTRAAGEGHLAAVQRLGALGADVNHRHDDLGSPLAAAVHRRHRDVATFLDQHGAREWQ